MDGPGDPQPSLAIRDGEIVELDGRALGAFDVIDHFIARHGIDLAVAGEAMALSEVELAHMLVDVSVGRAEVVRLARGLTPAKLARVMGELDAVELMFAMKKLRARRQPGNQAHVTNLKENPALLAADAAEASLRGFDEMETTVGVARYAPLNAIALLVGSQTGRGGSLTQCAVEERRNLQLALLGLVTYAETLSVYGTEPVFVDGDDSPWSKAFLASAYASRGVKVRFTSGGGSEALMGHSEGCSMLYLEARCLAVARAAGSQGVQNGSISCIALELSLPGGTRAVLAENVLAAWLDLEVASGNDAIASHSEIRKTGKLMGQFLPGTDLVTSGYSVMPRRDNMFGGGDYDADDLDEWLTLQRDWQIDGGIEPASEEEVDVVRRRAARAIQAVFGELGLPPVSDREVEAAVIAHSSLDVPDRDRAADVIAADELLARGVTGAEIALALDRRGFGEIAERVFAMQRQRISADYLQTAAVIDQHGDVRSAVNDPNAYAGPGTGWRLEGEHWQRLQALPHEIDAASERAPETAAAPFVIGAAPAVHGSDEHEVVIAIGPAVGAALRATISELDHRDVLDAIAAGIAAAGARPRLVRVRRTSDVAQIALDGARLSGSGIAIGLQSKGTAVIHRADLQPLDNLELFSMAPLYTLASYRAMGHNAARYAVGGAAAPVPTELDTFARAKLIVRTVLLHRVETDAIERDAAALDVALVEGWA